ncbi:Alpha/Beta hydrolase protein [Phycomyces nitens]|nr:Alpha/Beta hydrolase protein [Phycomyces nitens]
MYLLAWIIYLQLAQTHVEFNLPFNPSRVLKINLVVLDLIVGWIYEIPIIVSFVYWRYWTMRNQRFQHIVKRDIVYSDNDPECKLDVYSPGLVHQKKAPIIVFIYGGSWSSGSKYIYTPLANTLREMGYVVIVPDYRKYPRHAPEIHGDSELLYVMGHSAGAHLVSQVVLTDLVDKASYSEAARDRLNVSISEKHDPAITKPFSHLHGVYDFLPQVEGLLLLAGVYNIETHLEHETSRGVEKISAMARAMGSSVEGYRSNSPTQLIKASQTLFATSTEVIDFMPRILFIHGEIDTTVPMEQSAEMYNILGEVLSPERRDEVDVRMRLYKRMSHSQCVTAFMPSFLGKDKLQKSLTRDIQEFINVPVDEDE